MLEYFMQMHAQVMDADRIPLAVMAILLAMIAGIVTGPLIGNANPLIWIVIDKIFGGIGDRLNKTHRPRADLVFRGFLVTAAGLFLALGAGRGALVLSAREPLYGFTEILLLSFCLCAGTVWFAVLRLYFALEKRQVGQGAYYAISRSTRTNLAITDDYGITRAGMGFTARAFDKGLVAPVFWYLIGGLPLAYIYAVLAGLSWRLGKDGFSKGIGVLPLELERLMGIVPSLFSALLITCAGAFTPTAKLRLGLVSWLGHKNRASYTQGGFPLSALAWSLNVGLGGASQDLSGSAIKGEWVGPEGATAQNDHRHLRRALYITATAHILFLAALLGAYIWAPA